MNKLFFLPILALTACLPAVTPTPPPPPPPGPTPVPEVYAITSANCPTVRVHRDNGEYSNAWGGVDGLVVPPNGFSIQAKREQIECRINGVFMTFKE